MKQRDISLDVVRCLACIMVVLMHSPMPDANVPAIVQNSINLLTAPCIGMFFMVSGALLLPAIDDAKTFLRRRFSKIAYPAIFWSLFYIAVSYIFGSTTFEIQSFAKLIFSIPFSAQGHGIMWFMYTLAGLYLITPIISPWIKIATKRQLQFYLSLWLISMCYPLLKYVVGVNDSNTGILYYFSGYVGYFVLGCYLKYYQPKISKHMALVLLLIPMTAATMCKLNKLEVDFYSLFWYLSIFTVMMCVVWFSMLSQSNKINQISGKIRLLIISFSNCSFGIYLIHIFVMRNVLWKSELLLKWGGYHIHS